MGQAVRHMLTQTRLRSVSYAKGFAAVGALFAGSECVIEKVRHSQCLDTQNAPAFSGTLSSSVASRQGQHEACLPT